MASVIPALALGASCRAVVMRRETASLRRHGDHLVVAPRLGSEAGQARRAATVSAAKLHDHAPRTAERPRELAELILGQVVTLIRIGEQKNRIRRELERGGDSLVMPRAPFGVDRLHKPPHLPLGVVVGKDGPPPLPRRREHREPIVVEDHVKLP